MKDGKITSVEHVKVPGSESSDAVEVCCDGIPVALVKVYSSTRPSRFGGGRMTVRILGGVRNTMDAGEVTAIRCDGLPVAPPEPEPVAPIHKAPKRRWQ